MSKQLLFSFSVARSYDSIYQRGSVWKVDLLLSTHGTLSGLKFLKYGLLVKTEFVELVMLSNYFS